MFQAEKEPLDWTCPCCTLSEVILIPQKNFFKSNPLDRTNFSAEGNYWELWRRYSQTTVHTPGFNTDLGTSPATQPASEDTNNKMTVSRGLALLRCTPRPRGWRYGAPTTSPTPTSAHGPPDSPRPSRVQLLLAREKPTRVIQKAICCFWFIFFNCHMLSDPS